MPRRNFSVVDDISTFGWAMGECLCEPTPVERVFVAIPRTTAIYRYADFSGLGPYTSMRNVCDILAPRGLIVRSTHLAFCFAAILFTVSVLHGTSPNDSRAGVLLESASYDWCHADCGPFNTESIFICIQVDGKTLIGVGKDANDLQEYYHHPSDKPGTPISVRYDDRSIWLITRDSKQIHFDQGYERDLFNTPACIAEIHRHMLKRLGDVKKPPSVPADAVLIPEGGRFVWNFYSWVRCSLDADENDDICTYWDKVGHKDYEDHVVSEVDRKPVLEADLQVDTYTTRHNDVRLKNGVRLVSDGRARINGKLVNEQPKP
jgi:hypothetical protein